MAQSPWTAIVHQDDGWWIGRDRRVPGVRAQEPKGALAGPLLATLAEALALNRQDALEHAPTPHEEIAVAL